jgi:transposase-like protein
MNILKKDERTATVTNQGLSRPEWVKRSLIFHQVREGSFYPSSLEKGIRNERALTLTLAEMYVQGISSRKVAA